jgi:hypothetical protein
MSSAPPHHQHLSSTDMTMLDRVLKDVCDRNSIAGGSPDAQLIAALLITEFQRGVNKEADLTMAFVGDGSLRLHVPVGRLSRLMGNRLFGWEDDVGPGALGSSNKERIA